MPLFPMREHPIPPVTEPLQYRAIGIIRGTYCPDDTDQMTRGRLVDLEGLELEAVVLGRVLTLMRRHLVMEKPHLWVVYPRCREVNHLHLQIAGIWEPSTLGDGTLSEKSSTEKSDNSLIQTQDKLKEGDDYFSIRGELIYTKPETNDLVVRIRQKPKPSLKRSMPFKLQLKGCLPIENLRNFVSLKVRRQGQELHLEECEVLGPILTRGGKYGVGKSSTNRRDFKGSKTTVK